jgi:hypothetical protein
MDVRMSVVKMLTGETRLLSPLLKTQYINGVYLQIWE